MTLARASAWLCDSAMCSMMYAVQRRHRLHAGSRRELEDYVARHEPLTRDAYFSAPPLRQSAIEPPASIPGSVSSSSAGLSQSSIHWPSPIVTGVPRNDRAHVDLYPCRREWSAPTVIFLHALMSASDFGYRRWAADFNARGWNACFVHLPFHYSRKPRGHFNGELAITADAVRTAEGLRQGVCELRQLLALLRSWGCSDFALWASSYGGWIGALLASVERDFRWIALMQPIVDVDHAIWVSPTGAAVRRELRRVGIEPAMIARHFPLASPLHGHPLCGGDHVLLGAGDHDRIARAVDIARLHERWPGSHLLHVAQGHFGYRMMRRMWAELCARGWV